MFGVYLLIVIVICQRVIELVIANKNAAWIKSQGGYEVGKEDYKNLVSIHIFFFISLLIEVTLNPPGFVAWSFIPFIIFLASQLGRVWALSSLGVFWNTRIMILPGAKVIAKGPYQYIRHPNYLIVAIEILTLPLIFQAYWTAVIFTIANVLAISERIRIEEKALKEATNYEEVFENRGRFIPSFEE